MILDRYLKEIKQVRESRGYLGEIILQEDELQELFSLLSKVDLEKNSPEMIACLTIAAVNCAFYYYDDEGFWKHFHELIKDEYMQDDYYGRKIIKYMIKEGFVNSTDVTYGPFRYVRQVLLQSGISRRHIPRFAEFINTLQQQFGISSAITMSFPEFKETLNVVPNSAKYLKMFLSSESGWKYTRDVLKHLEAGYSKEELSSAKGFHKDLWEYIFQSPEDIESTKAFLKYKKPFLSFDPVSWQIGIQFDRKGINDYIFKMGGKTVRRSFEPLGIDTSLEEKYSGEMYLHIDNKSLSREWTVNVFNLQKEECVLFHTDAPYQYVKDKNKLLSGRYYLILPENIELKEEVLNKLEAYEERELEHEASYLVLKVYNVCLKDGATIESLGIRTLSYENIQVEWIGEGQKLEGVIDNIDVWIERIMPLKINIPSNLCDRTIVYQDLGDGREKVESSRYKNTLLDINLQIGIEGRIWLQPYGRFQIADEIWEAAEKNFCCLPNCQIQWPKGLYSYNEKPEIIFVSNEPIEIEWTYPEGVIPLSTNTEKKWQLPEGCNRAEGILRYKQIEIRLARRIFRSRLTPDVIWHEKLAERFNISLWALPEIPFTLSLINKSNIIDVYESKTIRSGQKTLISDDIVDAIKNFNQPVGKFVIKYENRQADTESIFINTEKLITDCNNGNIESEWADYLPENIWTLVELVTNIRLGADKKMYLNSGWIDTCHSVMFRDWVVKHLIASKIFDGYNFLEAYEEYLDNNWNKFYKWSQKCEEILSQDANSHIAIYQEYFEEGKQYRKLIAGLSVERWKETLELWLSTLKIRSDINKLLLEWKNEIIEGTLDDWDCEIARMEGGKEVTKAWYYYSKNKFNSAYRYLHQPEVRARIDNIDNTVVKALESIAKIFSLFRFGDPQKADELIKDGMKRVDNQWIDSFILLEILYLSSAGKTVEEGAVKRLSAKKLLLLKLPLLDMDKHLIQIIVDCINKKINKTDLLALANADWFSAWVFYNLANQLGLEIKDKLIISLKNQDVPSSPIKYKIETKLYRS